MAGNLTGYANAAAVKTALDKAGTAVQPGLSSYFAKANSDAVAWEVTGANAIRTVMDLHIEVAGSVKIVPALTTITTPSPTAGTDYIIWCKPDGSLEATADYSSGPVANSRRVGGYHYAPGGNAPVYSVASNTDGVALASGTVPAGKWALYKLSINAAGAFSVTGAAANTTAGYDTEALAIAAIPANVASSADVGFITVRTASGLPFVANTDALKTGTGGNPASETNYYSWLSTLAIGTNTKKVSVLEFAYGLGGDSTPQINPYSCWDLKWRPCCPDPRGMTLVNKSFWRDIYTLNVTPDVNGTSRFGELFVTLYRPPCIPAALGGNGTRKYSNFNYATASAIYRAYGKRLPTYSEFMAAAYGVTENSGMGEFPSFTGLDAPRTSAWGVMQATGNAWELIDTFGGSASSSATGMIGGGSFTTALAVGRAGGHGTDGITQGSRAVMYDVALASPGTSRITARGVCDHRIIL